MRWQFYKQQYEEILEKFKVQGLVKIDLDQKLKHQMDQTHTLLRNHDEDEKLIRSLRQDLKYKDHKLREALDRKSELEHDLSELEERYDQLKLKFDDTHKSLRQTLENEKESRASWKERYEREQENAQTVSKQNLALKYTVKDQSSKIHKLETSLSQTQEEKEALAK